MITHSKIIQRAMDTKEKTTIIINNLYKDIIIDSDVKFTKLEN